MAEYIKVPAGVYDMVTRCMEQEFPDHVAIRYVAEDGKTVVEKKYRGYAQDIRRMTAYLKAEVPDIKGRRIVLLSRNCYEFCVASFGIILAGGVLVTLNQKKTWDELEYELGLVEPALILNDGIDYGWHWWRNIWPNVKPAAPSWKPPTARSSAPWTAIKRLPPAS
jgi:long-chain acyl-CoA synthetase